MEFSFTEEQNQFRKEVRGFLEEGLKKGIFEVTEDGVRQTEGVNPQFSRHLAQKGWVGMAWPKEYGGGGRPSVDRFILSEELMRYGAPVAYHWMGERQVGPALIAFGSEEQKKEFLPKLVKAEISFWLGFSEPDAGTDLASLKTTAIEDGDYYVLNGQKTWSSNAHLLDYCWLLAKTDLKAPKYHNVSEFIVDTKLPGITVQSITLQTNAQDVNDVFLDNVRVHKKYLVGEKNRGFQQIIHQLVYERCDFDRLMSIYPSYVNIVKYVRDNELLAKDVVIRHKLAELEIEFEVGRLLCYRVAWLLDKGKSPDKEAAMAKLFCTEVEQRQANVMMQILGLYGQLLPESSEAPLGGRAPLNYLYCPMYTLAGGSSEILRNIIAIRGHGLPRD